MLPLVLLTFVKGHSLKKYIFVNPAVSKHKRRNHDGWAVLTVLNSHYRYILIISCHNTGLTCHGSTLNNADVHLH